MQVKSILQTIIYLFIYFIIFIVIAYPFVKSLLKDEKIDGKHENIKMRICGFVMQLDNFAIFAISTNIIQFIFIIYVLSFITKLNVVDLYVLIYFGALFGILSKRVSNFLISLVSNIALYIGMYLAKILTNYIIQIRFTWYIAVGDFLLIVFIIMFSVFFFLRNNDNVVSNTKYIRRSRNNET